MSEFGWAVYNSETGIVLSLWPTRKAARADAERRNVYPPGTPGLIRVRRSSSP